MADALAPHLLYVAWGYPPARGGGVYRALATPNAFARAGWRVTVLTVDRAAFERSTGADPSLEERIDESITVVRVPFDVASHQVELARWSRWRARWPELWNGWRGKRDRAVFPESVYGAWRPVVEAAALSVHDNDPVDLTIATANPHVDFAAAFALHRDRGVPYVMDYRDAWQLDVFSGKRVTPPGSPVDRWERSFIAAAHEVWFVNEPIRRWHRELYPEHAERMHVVANGFDADLAGFSPRVRAGRDDGLVFGYIGTLTDQVPLTELLAGWREARRQDALLAQSTLELHGYIGHAGLPDERWSRLLREYANDGVRYLGPVPKANIAETYARFDALVLLLGTGAYVTSGKIFEYCATGLPIAAVHDPGNAATDVLVEHPAVSAVRGLQRAEVASALVEAARLAREQTEQSRAAVQQWAASLERRAQLEPRIHALGAVVRPRSTEGAS